MKNPIQKLLTTLCLLLFSVVCFGQTYDINVKTITESTNKEKYNISSVFVDVNRKGIIVSGGGGYYTLVDQTIKDGALTYAKGESQTEVISLTLTNGIWTYNNLTFNEKVKFKAK